VRLVDQEKIKEFKRLEDAVVTMTPHQVKPLRSPAQELELGKKVTKAFQKEKNPFRRELAIQKILLKERLEPIRDDDLFAGRFGDGFFGYLPEIAGSYVGFYFMEPCLDQYLNSDTVSELERKEWEELRKFWRENATHKLAYRQAWAEIVSLKNKISAQGDDLPEHWQLAQTTSAWMWFVKETTNRVAGPYLNIGLLLAKGINGLKELIKDVYAVNTDPNIYLYYESALALLDFFSDKIIASYEEEADTKGKHLLSAALARIKKDPLLIYTRLCNWRGSIWW